MSANHNPLKNTQRNRSTANSVNTTAAMPMLLSAFLHGASATELGIGSQETIGYIQCPDPGPPCTKGGTVLFKLKQEIIQ